MNKLYVEIYVPALEKTFDFFLPENLPIYDVAGMVKAAVENVGDGRFTPDENTVLCSRETGEELDPNRPVRDSGLKNGSRLMLI